MNGYAFLVYRDLPKRSIELASRECNQHASSLGRWSTKFQWTARTLAWRDHLQAVKDRVAADYEERWERRRMERLEVKWKLAEILERKAAAMLETHLADRKVSKDGMTTVIKPGRWGFGTAADYLRLADEMKGSAMTSAAKPPAECTDAELEAIVRANHEAKDAHSRS